jgi:Tfp pilus assembly protein PilF/ADP-heptose:LPS heptosyltransferase
MLKPNTEHMNGAAPGFSTPLCVRGGIGDFLQCLPFMLAHPERNYVVMSQFSAAEAFFQTFGIEANFGDTISNLDDNATADRLLQHIRAASCPRAPFFAGGVALPLKSVTRVFSGKRPVLGIHLGGSEFSVGAQKKLGLVSKVLPVGVVHSFTNSGYDILLFGTRREIAELGIVETDHLRFVCDPDATISLAHVAQCQAFVGSDSAFKTMAAMLRIPTVVWIGDYRDDFRDQTFIDPYVKAGVMATYRYTDLTRPEQVAAGIAATMAALTRRLQLPQATVMVLPQPSDAGGQMLRLGHERLKAGDAESAKALFAGAINADNNFADAYHNLALVEAGALHYDAAIAMSRRAVVLKPNDGMVWMNLGNALWRAKRYDEAVEATERAASMSPKDHKVYLNLGLAYYATNRTGQAVAAFERALELKPGDLGGRNDLAHAVLKSGDLTRGLQLLECRWDGLLAKNPIWDCGLPRWEGERREASTLLLHHEQGFGDTLQFVRFIPQIKARCGARRVIFAAPKGLHRLLEGQCGIDELIDHVSAGDIVKAAMRSDAHCPLMSAVAALKLDYARLPTASPYLKPSLTVRDKYHDGDAKLAVGLVWAASHGHERSRQRSVKVAELFDLVTVPGVKLWSLQFAPYAQELVDCGGEGFVGDATAGVTDFADTAAILQHFDLVITVDTAMVHLAGALGVKCFMLNPINPCWRWCNGSAPWYGSVELFDQGEIGNWRAPIASIKDRVAAMVAAVALAA